MHCFLLNIMKMSLWYTWSPKEPKAKSTLVHTASTANIESAGESDDNEESQIQPSSRWAEGTSEYLPEKASLKVFEEVLRRSRSQIPSAIGDIPSSLNWIRSFKASEWQAILQTYGPPLLLNHIDDAAQRNLCLLSQI